MFTYLSNLVAKWLVALSITLFLVTACSKEIDPELGELRTASQYSQTVSYSNDIAPIFESRCIACHSCYDAPCQLKLTAFDGLQRGGSKTKVYNPTRLKQAPLSRLFFDAESVVEWRDRGFHSVLAENHQSKLSSTLLGMVELKTNHPIENAKDFEEQVPIADPKSWQCSSNRDEFLDFAADHPKRGMPYGLPSLTTQQINSIHDWVASGSTDDSDYSLSEYEQKEVDRWETFLNGSSLKQQLVARYIYEHIFLAHLYFENSERGRYFQLVRSTTPPGTEIDLIATRQPFGEPGVGRPYYRLRLNKETTVAKTHMPYRLDQSKMDKWTKWFFETDYEVTQLPSYSIQLASNPFKTFAALPAKSRYQFMLEEANFTVKGFIKGPVCKGPTAVNVITEHFWVFFVDPENQTGQEMMDYLGRTKSILELPAEKEDTLNLLGSWDEYADMEKVFLKERRKFTENYLETNGTLTEQLIWSGDESNPNAALTVFRHFDHATVKQGLIGQTPKTIWVIDYPLLERIHYLLVAGYDVYGNISHQLLSRIYMDFLRMEGESMFLNFLPQKTREELRQHWYRKADRRVEKFLKLTDIKLEQGSIVDDAKEPKLALLEKFKQRVEKAAEKRHLLDQDLSESLVTTIEQLQSKQKKVFNLLPETLLVELQGTAGNQYFTMLKNVGHLNNTSLLFEKVFIAKEETSVSVIPGFLSDRPNGFLSIPSAQAEVFFKQLGQLENETEFKALFEQYLISRIDPGFWEHYDRFQQGLIAFSRNDYGALDLNKYGKP